MSQGSASFSTETLPLEDRRRQFVPWRPPVKTSGRGGAGNIHTTVTPNKGSSGSSSDSLDTSSFLSFRSFRKPRFLSLPHTGNTKPRSKSRPHKAASFGRGGAGNRRTQQAADTSNKSSPLPDITQLERQYLLARQAWRPHQSQSSGRGGAGNITSLPNPVARAVQVLVSVTRR